MQFQNEEETIRVAISQIKENVAETRKPDYGKISCDFGISKTTLIDRYKKCQSELPIVMEKFSH